MNTIVRIALIFLMLSVGLPILVSLSGVQLGEMNFWSKHGLFFLFFIAVFPRLTLFFSSVPFGGIFWWLGFFFCPRFMVAILATVNYWQSNPILVSISWLFAFGGESAEKVMVNRRVIRSRSVYRPDHNRGDVIDI